MDTNSSCARSIRPIDPIHGIQSCLNTLTGKFIAQHIDADTSISGPIITNHGFDAIGGVGVTEGAPPSHALHDLSPEL